MLMGTVCRILSLAWTRVAGRLVRPVIGSAVMAAVLVACELHAAVPDRELMLQLVRMAGAALAGAAAYATTVLGIWLAMGHREGAEADLLRAAGQTLGQLRSRRGA